jgi:hypothetical protein
MEQTHTQSRLLAIWERGAGERTGARALTMLGAAAPETTEGERALLSVGRRDALLLDLRERLFGSLFTGLTSCPSCGEELELEFAATEVRRAAASNETAALRVDGIDLDFRPPNGGDLAAIDSALDIAAARAQLLARCVVRANCDGNAISADKLPPRVIDAVAARMGELDPQADVAVEMDCPGCGHAWREPFDVVTFLWNELAVWARRLLEDVHLLASVYGWSESEILRLTPLRRNAYLEMLR